MTGLTSFAARASRLGAALRSQAILLTNAGALAAGTFTSSVLGFAYWWLAARAFASEAVGLTAAAVSIMSLIGLVGQFGLGTLLIGGAQIHERSHGQPDGQPDPAQASALISTSLATSLVASLALGAGFIGLARAFSVELGAITSTSAGVAWFIAGCGAAGFSLVLDNAFLGLLRSPLLTYRNAVFSTLKLALLALLAVSCGYGGGEQGEGAAGLEEWIFVTWAATQTVTAVLFAVILFVVVLPRPDRGGLVRPRLSLIAPHLKSILSYHLLDMVAQAPAIIMPFLVAVLLSPVSNAAFNAAWLIIRTTFLVPAALSTILFAVGNSDPHAFVSRLRFSLGVCMAVSAATALGFVLLSNFILGVFNPVYPEVAGGSLQVLGASLFAISINSHYMAIQRLRRRMLAASGFFACGGLFELLLAYAGSRMDGLFGLSVGWTAAVLLQSLFGLPVVLSAMELPGVSTLVRRGVRITRLLVVAVLVLASSCLAPGEARAEDGSAPRGAPSGFVRAEGDHFLLDGRRYPVVGVNNHYLTYGSPGEVVRVLDDAVAMGANVVRTFVQPVIGSLDGVTVPTIWRWKSRADSSDLGVHGAYMFYWDVKRNGMGINEGENGLRKLDFLVAEARKRNLRLIIAFLDFWDFTGGSQQMRAWYGSADKNTFFFEDERTKKDYRDLTRAILGRVNPLTGVAYKDEPAIFAWELMNEPDSVTPPGLLRRWLSEMSAYVKSLDDRHMVASGLANITDELLDVNIDTLDFITWHGYPLYRGIPVEAFTRLIGSYCDQSAIHGKPVLLEEFGYARSNANFVDAYRQWLDAVASNSRCPGWLAWRLVSLQDSQRYPKDAHDQFDVHKDGGALWTLLKDNARIMVEKAR